MSSLFPLSPTNMQSKAKSCESSNIESIRKANSSANVVLSLNQPQAYFCSRCSRGFPTSQSLGGHQNAHRKEQNAERKHVADNLLEKTRTRTRTTKTTTTTTTDHLSPILSPDPLSIVPPPPTDIDKTHLPINSDAGFRLDKLRSPNDNKKNSKKLSRLQKFLSSQAQKGQALLGSSNFVPSPPAPALVLRPPIDLNLQMPYGFPLDYENQNPKSLYNNNLIDLRPNNLQLRVEANHDATAFTTYYYDNNNNKGKEKVTFNDTELDLTLKL